MAEAEPDHRNPQSRLGGCGEKWCGLMPNESLLELRTELHHAELVLPNPMTNHHYRGARAASISSR